MRNCKTPGKLAFGTRREAYNYFKRKKNISVYECHCGKYHGTHKKYH